MSTKLVNDPAATAAPNVERISPRRQKRDCSFVLFNPVRARKIGAIPLISNLVIASGDFIWSHLECHAETVSVECSKRNVRFGSLAVIHCDITPMPAFGQKRTLQQCLVALLCGQRVGKRLPPLT